MKITLKKLICITFTVLALTGCEAGIVEDTVPESVMNEVGLNETKLVSMASRRFFEQNICQVNYPGQPMADILITSTTDAYQTGTDYVNKGNAAVTINGITVQPGESAFFKYTMTGVDESAAPEGKLYKVDVYVNSEVTYNTPNKGNLFVPSTFKEGQGPLRFESEDQTHPGYYKAAVYKTDLKQIIVSLILQNVGACRVEPINGAPAFGKPGDFSAPRRYMVINEHNRPNGLGQRKRLYEIKIHVLP